MGFDQKNKPDEDVFSKYTCNFGTSRLRSVNRTKKAQELKLQDPAVTTVKTGSDIDPGSALPEKGSAR